MASGCMAVVRDAWGIPDTTGAPITAKDDPCSKSRGFDRRCCLQQPASGTDGSEQGAGEYNGTLKLLGVQREY
jgi:hypothetical protein